MKVRTTLLVSAIVVGLAASFWLYGGARTMRETVSFDIVASVSGFVFGVLLPLVIILPPLLVAKKLWHLEKGWRVPSWFIAFAICLLVGSLASEAWILRDEAQFSAEVSKTNKEVLYSRSRTWPNQTCSLVFVPGQGIHATD